MVTMVNPFIPNMYVNEYIMGKLPHGCMCVSPLQALFAHEETMKMVIKIPFCWPFFFPKKGNKNGRAINKMILELLK